MWCLLLFLLVPDCLGLAPAPQVGRGRRTCGEFSRSGRSRVTVGDGGREDYVNPLTEFLGKLIPKEAEVALEGVDFGVAKRRLSPEEMAKAVDAGLRDREWFVTGRVLPELFSDGFEFKDPDVSLKGIDAYAKGVARLFDRTARCEVISCDLDGSTIRIDWRLSGGVKIGPGLTFKPYVVSTDLVVEDGLIVYQEDRFSIPGWQILVGAVAPWLPTPVPAPPADELRARARGA